jgi:CBS domain-containing protein
MKLLENIYAADVMESDVVTFTPSTPIADALRTFEDLRINGAPVVDFDGRIVGMLSAADVARPAHLSRGRIDARADPSLTTAMRDVECEGEAEDIVHATNALAKMKHERPAVGDWMSTGVRCAEPEWTLARVCRLMKGERIHRVPVVKDRKLVGIITSFDVVCCVADDVVQLSAKRIGQ